LRTEGIRTRIGPKPPKYSSIRCFLKPEDAHKNLEKLANKFRDTNYLDTLIEKKILKAKKTIRQAV
jgi:hypothetical protein